MGSERNKVTLQNDHGRAVLSPLAGASLRSLRVRSSGSETHELLVGGEGPHDPLRLPSGTGSFIMAPWPNRIRDGELHATGALYRLPVNMGRFAIHGTVRDRAWQVLSASSTTVRLAVELGDPWPFGGLVLYEASLEGPSFWQSLTIQATEGGQPFPAGLGWHPWFRRNLGTGDVRIHVPGQEIVWELDHEMCATGRQLKPQGPTDLRWGLVPEVGSLDHCLRIEPGTPAQLEWPGALTLEIRSSPEVSHLQVYTPEDAVCVEPQSCTVDAFRLAALGIEGTGAAEAAPGRPFTGWTRWSWE